RIVCQGRCDTRQHHREPKNDARKRRYRRSVVGFHKFLPLIGGGRRHNERWTDGRFRPVHGPRLRPPRPRSGISQGELGNAVQKDTRARRNRPALFWSCPRPLGQERSSKSAIPSQVASSCDGHHKKALFTAEPRKKNHVVLTARALAGISNDPMRPPI